MGRLWKKPSLLTSAGTENGSSVSIQLKPSTHDLTLLYQFQDTLPVATEADFIELFEWASHKGASLEGIACRTDEYGGRGLFSTAAVPTGGILAMLPRSLRLGQSYACQTLKSLPVNTPDLTALTMLVLQFCKDKHVYAKCLPRQGQFTNALLMSKKEQSAWGKIDSRYSDAFKGVQSIAQGCEGYIRNVLMESDTTVEKSCPSLSWAIAMVKSRSHAFGSKRGYWLTPVLDLVNHSPEPNAMLVGGDQGQLLLKAVAPIQEGEQIKIDYQIEDDAMLLATYGFSLCHETPTCTT